MIRALSTISALLFLLPCFGASPAGNPTVSVDTIADLVARNPVPNERVLLSGFRSAGDFGPQRIVRHDPSSVAATNLGCVYANAGSGRYLAEDCEGGEVDVRWFGADATGVLPSSAAIQAATDYGTNVVVTFPPGIFLIDATITNVGTAYFTHSSWRGATKAMAGQRPSEFITVLKAAPELNAPIVSFGNPRMASIDGIAFDGSRDTQTGFTGDALVELVGGYGALNSDLSNVSIYHSVTNGLKILRSEVQFERVKVQYNDGDGIVFGDSGGISVDCSLQNVQVGFNKGSGLIFTRAWNARGVNIDTYFNNGDGIQYNNVSLGRIFGLQSNNNGRHGIVFNGNNRNIAINTGLIYDSNWSPFDNYADSSVVEGTNSAPSGTYNNVHFPNDGGEKTGISFTDVAFAWGNGGGYYGGPKPGYQISDERTLSGVGIALVNCTINKGTNHFEYGMVNGITNWANINGLTIYGEGGIKRHNLPGLTKNLLWDGRAGYQGPYDDWPLSVRMATTNSLYWPRFGFWLNQTNDFDTYGPVRSGVRLGQILWSGMTDTNGTYATPARFEVQTMGEFGPTNYPTRFLFFSTPRGESNNVFQLGIQDYGRLYFAAQPSDPAADIDNAQVYFNTNNGLTQRRGGAWETLAVSNHTHAYLPLAGGAMTGPATSSSTWSGTSFTGTGASAALWTQVRTSTNDLWGFYSQTQDLKLYWFPPAAGRDVFSFATNGSLSSLQGIFWNSGNDGAGSGLDADTVRGLSFPTNNGAYVLFVTNGVASWIAHP